MNSTSSEQLADNTTLRYNDNSGLTTNGNGQNLNNGQRPEVGHHDGDSDREHENDESSSSEDENGCKHTESKSVRREIYRSEKVESSKRTVPEEKILSMENRYFDPTELGPPEMSSTSYNYSYESTMEEVEPPVEETTLVDREIIYRIGEDTDRQNGFVSVHEDEQLNIERQQKQTQKVTRTTKVTTTRTVQHIPVDHDGSMGDVDYTIVTTPGPTEHHVHHHHHHHIDDSTSHILIDDGEITDIDLVISSGPEVPSQPGQPQIVEIDCDHVTFVWLRPDRTGEAGPLLGYIVQYKRVGELHWHIANKELTIEPLCKLQNLHHNGEYELRVLAKNKAGYGVPSLITVVQLRPSKNGSHGHLTKPPYETDVPLPPGRPRVIECDGVNVTLTWEPPISSGRGGPVAGYRVEYRTVESLSWISATDYLIRETRYTEGQLYKKDKKSKRRSVLLKEGHLVTLFTTHSPNDAFPKRYLTGLRPNGEYEFRIFAKNADGYSPPSQTSGEFRVTVPKRPVSPTTGHHHKGVPNPPSQPQVTDVDSDTVTLLWAPPPASMKHEHLLRAISYVLQYREIGDPNWFTVTERPILGTQFTVTHLHKNSTYEFRVFARNEFGLSDPSEVSELCQLRPKITDNKDRRHPPSQPNPPEIMSVNGDSATICWAPVHSMTPLQGYQVEFADLTHSPHRHEWAPVTDILTHSCKLTVENLSPGREYCFRVIAKNAIGYSKPSEPSQRIIIAPDVEYRDPTLPEVLEYLTHPNNVFKLNASGYLQHLTFHSDNTKHRVRELDGIPKVIDLLRSEVPEIQRNASGCLRNLSFGIEENKKVILNAGGVPALANLMKKTPDPQILEEVSSVLWNLSSNEDLKMPVLQNAFDPMVKVIVIPYSGWSAQGQFSDRAYPPAAFRNSTGVLRNISSANSNARKTLREREGLIDALVHYLHMSCQRREMDTKSVENVICVLRNLAYRLQEIEDPNYDKRPPTHERSKSAPSMSPKAVKKKNSKKQKDDNKENSQRSAYLFKQPATGVALLWQTEVVRDYLKLLDVDGSTNPETLEASAGAIQNLSACYWQPSVDVRASVRKEKGLPVLVNLLSVESDKVVCAAATALRNLSLDQRNKELIGKYAMEDLVKKMPASSTSATTAASASSGTAPPSDDTVAAVLSVLYAVTVRSPDFTKTLLDKGGIERLIYLSSSRQYSQRVSKYASQVLFAIWQHKELHDGYKRAGFREDDFVSRVSGGRHHADTLARPISTQGVEGEGPRSRVRPDWGDDYSSRSRVPSSMNVGQQQDGGGRTPPTPQPRTPQNGQQTPHSTTSEPTYSQVQKTQKGRQQLTIPAQSPGYSTLTPTNGSSKSPGYQQQRQEAQPLGSWV